MKLKKVLTLVLIFMLTFALVGCGNQNTEAALANNLDKNVSKLSTLISSLESVEYEDIIIDNISPLENVSYKYGTTQTSRQNNILQKTKSYEVGSLSGKQPSDNVITTSTKKQNANAKYVSNNGEKTDINNQNITNSNTILNQNKNSNHKTNYNKLNNNYCENGNCYSNTTTNVQNTRYSHTNSYRPKYVNEISENFSRNQLDMYLESIEEVYNMCADCVCCDAEYKNELSKLQQNIKDCKTYCSKLRDGTINLTEQEIKDCNECVACLTNCIARLKSTKGNIDSKTTEIIKNKDNFGNKISSLKEAYKSLYNALEGRLQYVKQCNENINCVFDILSKTNVDMRQAEKNKSDENDIIEEQKKLEKEQNALENSTNNESIINNNDNNNLNTADNGALNNNDLSQNNNDKSINDTITESKNKEIIDRDKNIVNKKDTDSKLDNQKEIVENNQNTDTTNKNKETQNDNEINSETKNENKIDVLNDARHSENNTQNISEKKTQAGKQIVTKRTQKTIQNQNTNNTQQNINNQNASRTINNGVNYGNGYGYGYPNGYNGPIMPYGNNVPYPPRNIDTYKTIVKNIDTYRPNYVPNNNSNTVEDTTTTYEIENVPEVVEDNNTDLKKYSNNENNIEKAMPVEEKIKTVDDVKN